MLKLSIMIIALLLAGCSPTIVAEKPRSNSSEEVEDGGGESRKDKERGEAENLLQKLGQGTTKDDERTAVIELATWLNEKGYKIVVEESDGKHLLLCPYFPPVTPWVEHQFLDAKNIELLPLEN